MAPRRPKKIFEKPKVNAPKKRKAKLTKSKPKKFINSIWKNPEFISQLRSKLDVLVKQRQKEEASTVDEIQTSDDSLFVPSTSYDDSTEIDDSMPSLPSLCCEKEESEITLLHSSEVEQFTHRHKALATIHNQLVGLEVKFQKEIFDLERMYIENYYQPLLLLRHTILNLNSKRSCKTRDEKEVLEACRSVFSTEMNKLIELKVHMRSLLSADLRQTEKPIEDFWLKVLLHSPPLVRDLIQPIEVDALRYLDDISTHCIARPSGFSSTSDELDQHCEETRGFEIRFEFRLNPYFANKTLFKRYVIELLPEDEDYVSMVTNANKKKPPDAFTDADLSLDEQGSQMDNTKCESNGQGFDVGIAKLLNYKGPQVVAIEGCGQIYWKTNACMTSSASADIRLSSTTPNTFFCFLQTSWVAEPFERHENIENDYRIGTYIRDVIIPRAYAIYFQPPDNHISQPSKTEFVAENQPEDFLRATVPEKQTSRSASCADEEEICETKIPVQEIPPDEIQARKSSSPRKRFSLPRPQDLMRDYNDSNNEVPLADSTTQHANDFVQTEDRLIRNRPSHRIQENPISSRKLLNKMTMQNANDFAQIDDRQITNRSSVPMFEELNENEPGFNPEAVMSNVFLKNDADVDIDDDVNVAVDVDDDVDNNVDVDVDDEVICDNIDVDDEVICHNVDVDDEIPFLNSALEQGIRPHGVNGQRGSLQFGTDPFSQKPQSKFSHPFNRDLIRQYGKVDNDVILPENAPSIQTCNNRFCNTDKSAITSATQYPFIQNLFQKNASTSHNFCDPSLTKAAGSYPSEDSNVCQSVADSRKRMADIVNKVNSLLKEGYHGKPSFHRAANPPKVLNSSVNRMFDSVIEDAIHLNRVKMYEDGSDLPTSVGAPSHLGDVADDENCWSDCGRPSINRAFARIKYDMKNKTGNEESNTTVTQEQLPSSSHSSQTKCQKERVKFRKVSPYPSDGEVDDSDILSTSQHTPIDTEDGHAVNVSTPSSTSVSDNESSNTLKCFNYKVKTKRSYDNFLKSTTSSENNDTSGAPFCSSGVPKRESTSKNTIKQTEPEIDDYDSEAPPPVDENVASCKQQ
ncbi:uncharacterized protein LOC143447101 [Clavelina lepadiformis]|uniref:uncharacterized protein LOC143447101 n=1 Tax=Clavelina lepadiformis TaxID=159417 RepID=UPI0040410964